MSELKLTLINAAGEVARLESEIGRLNATIDELIKQGNKGNMPYELWKREWNEIVHRIQKERE